MEGARERRAQRLYQDYNPKRGKNVVNKDREGRGEEERRLGRKGEKFSFVEITFEMYVNSHS